MKHNSIVFTMLLILFAWVPMHTQTKTGVYLQKTVEFPVQFSRQAKGPIGPSRYIVSKPGYRKFQIYDLQTGTFADVPSHTVIKGIPVAPDRKQKKLTRLRNQIAGTDWRYSNVNLIYYDSKQAGYLIERQSTFKNIDGNPVCSCGGSSRFVEKYQRYYCKSCRKYVPTKEYLTTKKEYVYYHFDLNAKKTLWNTKIKTGNLGLTILGTHAKKKFIYFSNIAYISKRQPKSSGQIYIQRLNLNSEKIDLNQKYKISVRSKSQASSWSLTPYFSLDFSWLAFIEYDEASNRKTNAPHLKNPGPQGYFINTSENKMFAVPIDVTTYGVAIDSKTGFAALASNQTGRVKLVNLNTGKIIKTIKGPKTVAQAFVSSNSKRLYVLNKSGLTHYSWPNLVKSKTVPIGKVFPGVKQMLTAEKMRITGDGKYGLIGKMLRSKHGPWYSSSPEKGFHILNIN